MKIFCLMRPVKLKRLMIDNFLKIIVWCARCVIFLLLANYVMTIYMWITSDAKNQFHPRSLKVYFFKSSLHEISFCNQLDACTEVLVPRYLNMSSKRKAPNFRVHFYYLRAKWFVPPATTVDARTIRLHLSLSLTIPVTLNQAVWHHSQTLSVLASLCSSCDYR